MALIRQYPFTTSGNYTFDSEKIEVTGGVARLKTMVYANETFFAGYHADINGHRGDGVLTGTGTGSPTVSDGVLDLTGPGVKFVSYAAADNFILTTIGTVRTGYIPNYTGNPAADRMVFSSGPISGSNNVLIIFHRTDNKFIFQMRDSSGVLITDLFTSTLFSATAGTLIDIELALDLTGTTRVFVNGTIEMSTTDTGTRGQADFIHVGTDSGKTLPSDCKIKYFHIFSDVKHTSNFTPTVEATDYVIDSPTIRPTETIDAEGLSAYTGTLIEPAGSSIAHVINVDDTDKFWNGTAWATSSGGSDSNTKAEINTNIPSLIAAGSTIYPLLYLKSTNGYVRPSIDLISIEYDFFDVAETITKCLVHCEIYDSSGVPLVGAKVTIDINDFWYGQAFITQKVSVLTDSLGKAELSIVETASNSATANIKIEHESIQTKEYKDQIIPNKTKEALSVIVA